MRQPTIYFAGLNGLRAIAALSIVISHTTLALHHFGLDPHILGTLSDGRPRGFAYASVTMFFVLSGFLITYLLLKEKETGSINVRKFYWRRILRIWPLYYLYLLVALITLIVAGLPFDAGKIWMYIFFTANIPYIFGEAIHLLEHYWSLGIEEQFYIFWPWVIKKLHRWLIPVIIGAIVLLVGTRLLIHFFYPNYTLERAMQVTRFHTLMIGALAAILYDRRHRLFLLITDNKITQLVCWVLLAFMMVNKFHVASIIDDEMVALVSVALIIGQINIRNRVINLEVSWMGFLGKISYGLYVIHPVLIYFAEQLIPKAEEQSVLNYTLVYGSIISVSILLAWVSYNYFEKYFLKMKAKFVVVKSSPAKTASTTLQQV